MQITVCRLFVLLTLVALVPLLCIWPGPDSRQSTGVEKREKQNCREVSQGAQQVSHRGASDAIRKEPQ